MSGRRQRRRRSNVSRLWRTILYHAAFYIVAAALAAVVLHMLGCSPPTKTADETEQTATAVEISPAAVLDKPESTEEISPISRYADIEITNDDIDTLACLVYHEARGEPFEGQVAVVEVVFNRILSPAFPDTVEEVVYQKYGDVWQFSPAPYLDTAEPDTTQYEAVYTAMRETEYILTAETVYFSTEPYNEYVSAIIGNHQFCEIGG